MKRILTYLMAVLMVTACYDDSEINSRLEEMDQRLTDVEAMQKSFEEQIQTLQKLLMGKLFISGVTENADGTHSVNFVNAAGELTSITLTNGKDGKDGAKGDKGDKGDTPDISVKQAPDGKWYWTVNGEWLTDAEGKTIPVTGERGVTPAMKIENGKWYVSYDNGITYIECGQATGADGDAFFQDAKVSEDGKLVYLTLADGTVLTFEIYKEFGIAVDVNSALIYSGETKEYPYTITGGDKNTILEVLPKGNWKAEAVATDDSNGVIRVTAPDEATVGKVILLLGDGADKTLMRTLTFVSGKMYVSTSSVESPSAGGTFDVKVTTNLEFTAELEADQTWARLVKTKAFEVYEETVSVEVDKNEMPYARQTKLTLKNDDRVIETIVIYQNPATYPDEVMVLMLKPQQKDSCAVLPVSYVRAKDYYVDWGDGTKDTLQVSLPKHKYSDPDRLYPVQVSGTLASICRSTTPGHYSDLIEVIQWGQLSITGVSFEYQENLERIPAPKGEELRAVKSSANMFHNCKKLKTVPIGFMDGLSTESTNFNNMFEGCESLEYLDPDFFRIQQKSPGKYSAGYRSLFKDCKKLKAVPTFKYFKFTTSCSDLLNQVFSGCESLETIPEHMFGETAKNVTNAKIIGSTFLNCKSLKSIPASFWENLPLSRFERFNSTFMGCEQLTSDSFAFLNDVLNVWTWDKTFNGCTSLTALPEKEIQMDTVTVSVPIWKRGDEEYQSYFAKRACSSTAYCFTGCVNLEGYYDKIPQAWGGGWDGTSEAPVISVDAQYPEGNGYYSIDFIVKGKSVASAYYYLSAKTLVDEVLPKYNNSYVELCEKRGIEIEADYLNAINSAAGLTLGFAQGVPNVEYILIVAGKNMFGQSYAYKVQATTSVPKGSDEYERYLGEWTVTTAGSASPMPGYESKPITFDIKVEPFRVDSIYNVYGWGVTKFTDTYPMKMYFEDGKLCAWTGAHHGSVIYEGYPYSDGISYNIALNSFALYEDGTYGVYMANGEKVGEGTYAESGFDMVGVKSKYYGDNGVDVTCAGFDYCLSMGGPGWSKIFIAPEVVKDQYVLKSGDEIYAPYILAPYSFKRKSTATTSSVTVNRNRSLAESGKCLPVRFGKGKSAKVAEPAPGFYRF